MINDTVHKLQIPFPTEGNEIADEFAREGPVYHFVGPETALVVSRQSTKKKIQCWLDKQHMTLRQGLAGTQRQA
jgi:hypothetical protein